MGGEVQTGRIRGSRLFKNFSIAPTESESAHGKSCTRGERGFLWNPIASDLASLKLFSHWQRQHTAAEKMTAEGHLSAFRAYFPIEKPLNATKKKNMIHRLVVNLEYLIRSAAFKVKSHILRFAWIESVHVFAPRRDNREPLYKVKKAAFAPLAFLFYAQFRLIPRECVQYPPPLVSLSFAGSVLITDKFKVCDYGGSERNSAFNMWQYVINITRGCC